jgi:hypothetical protein
MAFEIPIPYPLSPLEVLSPFDRVTGHLLGAFADNGAGVREQRELASLFGGLRADIVNP